MHKTSTNINLLVNCITLCSVYQRWDLRSTPCATRRWDNSFAFSHNWSLCKYHISNLYWRCCQSNEKLLRNVLCCRIGTVRGTRYSLMYCIQLFEKCTLKLKQIQKNNHSTETVTYRSIFTLRYTHIQSIFKHGLQSVETRETWNNNCNYKKLGIYKLVILALILFLCKSTTFPKNFHYIMSKNHNFRLQNSYNFCINTGTGYLIYLKQKFNIAIFRFFIY